MPAGRLTALRLRRPRRTAQEVRPPTPDLAYLGLGSNFGDRMANLRAAVGLLSTVRRLSVLRISPVYETEPVGGPPQPPYLNAVVEVETQLAPTSLLRQGKGVEAALGRTEGERWGPRPIDIDILLYGQRSVDTPKLTIPHPLMWERAFVLAPLADLLPDLQTPNGEHLHQRLRALQMNQRIRRCPEAI